MKTLITYIKALPTRIVYGQLNLKEALALAAILMIISFGVINLIDHFIKHTR
jgi:hypothetical protein